jgi:phosphoglycerate dehydrogenase-like enzyme
MNKPKALYILNPVFMDTVYGGGLQEQIAARVEVLGPAISGREALNHPELLRQAELILSGWGAPKMDQVFLDAAPNLKAVLYGAGSIKGFVTDEFWKRGIKVTSAYAANAVPVCEYTVAQIVLCTKRVWAYAAIVRTEKRFKHDLPITGMYGSTVGLVSLGMIGRMVLKRLKAFDVRVIAYDPFVDGAQAEELGVEMVSLEELFERADVVSLHSPWLKETEGMITGEHIRSMKEGASLINTSRGAIIRENEMVEILQERKDLTAVLDVTHPEPPRPESPLYTLPNVVLTPHIAGSMGQECGRMGAYMLEELDRYLAGTPFRWGITKQQAQVMA